MYFPKVMPGHMSLMLSGALSGIRNIRHDYNVANGNAGNAGLKDSGPGDHFGYVDTDHTIILHPFN